MKFWTGIILGVMLVFHTLQGASWKKVNPKGLENINALYMFNDSTAIVVGSSGGVLKTKDGGNTWYAIDLNTDSEFWDITFVNAKTGFLVGDNLVFRTNDGGETWEVLISADVYYTGVYFLNESYGWIAGNNNSVWKTSDGGDNWEYIPVTYSYNIFLNKPFFLDPDTGFVVGSEETIFKTTNGGKNWKLVNQRDFTPQWNFIVFIDDTTGWVGNYRGRVFRARSYGDFWSEDRVLTDSLLQYKTVTDMYFVDNKVGYVVTEGGLIASTGDGGKSWGVTQIPGAENDYLYTVHFSDYYHGMVAGAGGVIYKTGNGGQSWTKLSTSFTTENIIDATFINDSTGWIVTDMGKIYRTMNRGKTWQLLLDHQNPAIKAIAVGDTTVYAVGESGSILRSGVNLSVWTQLITSEPSDLLGVYAVNDSTVWVVGQEQVILRSTDYGGSWQYIQFPSQEKPHLFDVFAFSADRAVVAGQGFLYQTYDGGKNWSGLYDANVTFYSVFFVDSLHGWAVGSDRNVYVTTDAGATWTPKATGATVQLYDVFFLDQYLGWVVGQNGLVLETTNGGESWDEDARQTSQDLKRVIFTSKSSGWAFGNSGVILTGDASNVVAITSPEPMVQVPSQIQLHPAYPNPFNPSTTIPVSLSRPADVRLTVYNALGQVVRTLWEGRLTAGEHRFEWNGTNATNTPMPSGIYWVRLEATGADHPRILQSQKLLLIK